MPAVAEGHSVLQRLPQSNVGWAGQLVIVFSASSLEPAESVNVRPVGVLTDHFTDLG